MCLKKEMEVNMNYEEIKKLLEDMGDSKVDELQIEFPDGVKISMKKNHPIVNEIEIPQNLIQQSQIINQVTSEKQQNISEKEDCKIVKSPMVGTFYSKSSPTADAFVKVGDKVKKGDVLCIIEAMKLMNEIESEYDGEVIEICVKDEEMVEYGQPLIKIK